MLDSWLSELALAAVAVSAAALAALLRARDAAHKAQTAGAAWWVGRMEAAGAAALGGSGTAALLGAGPGPAAAVAGLLGGSVLGWALRRRSWRPAAVVAWAGGTVAAAAWLVWLVERAVSAASLGLALLLLGFTPLVVWGLVSLRRPVEGWLARGAETAGAETAGAAAPPARRTLLAVAAAVGPAVVAVPVLVGLHGSSAPTAGPGGMVDRSSVASSGGATPATAPTTGSTTSTRRHGPVPGDATATTAGSRTPSPAEATPTPTSAGSTATATTTPTTTPTSTPASAPGPTATKTPGYEKVNPNRPSDAPSPGGGRPR